LNKGKFVVIEGPDGVGKSTQIKLLCKYLKKLLINFKFIHFPRYTKKPYGEIISRYLSGDFGSADKVSPYLASLLYACDRKEADKTIRDSINKGIHVIADRHYLSNLAYQAVKITDPLERERFTKWLYKVEFQYNRLLKPNLYIYLDAPLEFVLLQNKKVRSGKERDYLSAGVDIHETDSKFQSLVFYQYKSLARTEKNIKTIKCYDDNGNVLDPKKINEKIIEELKKKRIP